MQHWLLSYLHHLTATANKGRLQTKTEGYKAKLSHKGGHKLTATRRCYKMAHAQAKKTNGPSAKQINAKVCGSTLQGLKIYYGKF